MSESRTWLWLVGSALAAWLVYLLTPILTPFAVGALLAYLGDPPVDRLEARGIARTVAVVIVFSMMFLLLVSLVLLLVPLLQDQIGALIERLPRDLRWLQERAAPWIQRYLGIDPQLLDIDTLKAALNDHWREAGNIAAQVATSVTKSGLVVFAWFANLLLIPVVTFYLLRDWDALVARVHALVPRRHAPSVATLARESDQVLGAFLRGQLSVMAALAVIYSTGLWLAGLQLSLLIGVLAGLVSFVPYLGFIVGIAAAGVAMFLQTHEWLPLAYVVAVFGVGQVLESMVLTPWLVGDRIGLHPVAVIFAVLAGGQLFGFVGVLLALPVAAVIAVVLRHLHAGYLDSRLYAGPEA